MTAHWTTRAACIGADIDVDFFPGDNHSRHAYARAKRVCHECPVTIHCLRLALYLEDGLAETSRWGMWAGLTPQQRALLDRRSA